MDPLLIALIGTVLMIVLIALGVPIAFAMGVSGFTGIIMMGGFPTLEYIAGHYPADRIMTYAFTALVLFILMGQLTFASGTAEDAYSLAYKWLSRLPGGLVLVTIAGCGVFAAATGSSVAEVAAMGRVALPEMKRYGYDTRLATGSVAAGSTVGILIPPSSSLVLYGILTYEPIGMLFIAGILPGIVSVLLDMSMVFIRCIRNPKLAPLPEIQVSWKDRLISLSKAWGIIVLFVIVIGGLYTGVATPTEVGALGSLAALIMVFLGIARGRTNWGVFKGLIAETVKVQAMVFAFIIGAGLYGLMVTMSGALPAVVEFVTNLQAPPIVIFSVVALCYIPLGMFLDPVAMLVVTLPFSYPIVVSGLGFNGLWFGIILVKLIELSMITPPMAINIYVLKSQFPEYKLGDIIHGCWWFMIMEAITIAILVAFPQITLWLPNTIGF